MTKNSMKLEINYKRKMVKEQTHGLHNTSLKPFGQDEIKEEIRKSLKTNANGNTIFQNLTVCQAVLERS